VKKDHVTKSVLLDDEALRCDKQQTKKDA